MSDREPLAPELKAVEAALASLAPLPTTTADRDRLMFAAGRAAVQRPSPWPQSLAVAVVVFGFLYLNRQGSQPTSPPTQRLAGTTTAVPPGAAIAFEKADFTNPSSYLQLRRNAVDLDTSIAAVPVTAPMHAVPTSRQDMIRELLN